MSFLGLPPNIEKLKEKGEVDKLIEVLQFRLEAAPKGAPVRQAAARALGELRDPHALGPLVALINADVQSIDVRVEAVRAIARIGGVHGIKALVAVLPVADHSRENAEFRAVLIKTLASAGTHAVEPLLIALTQPPECQQTAAAEILVRIGDPRAVRPLVELCEGTASPDVYHYVSDSLYRFQNPAAVPELIITLHEVATGCNEQLGLADNVTRTALERMTRVALGDDAREWAAWWDEEGAARMLPPEN